MTVKSCCGYFQISKSLGSIHTFQTESEIWPFALSLRHAGTPVSASARGLLAGVWASASCSSTTFSQYLDTPSFSCGCRHTPGTRRVWAQVSVMLKLLCLSKIYLNSVHAVCQTARYLDSIRVCYVWNVLTLHKFVGAEDYVKHKPAQGNRAASPPSPMHTQIDSLSVQKRNPFSPGSWFSEPTLKFNSSPESEIHSYFTPISAEFYCFLFFLFLPCCFSLMGLVLHCKELYTW